MILFFKDKINKCSLIFGIICNLLLWILFYFRIPIQVEPIALRYNIYVGINLIGAWQTVFWFPLIGLFILILNFILAKRFFRKDKLIAHFLTSIAFICQIILLVYGVLIVMMNI